MKGHYRYWKYLGLSKDSIEAFSDRVAKDNLAILRLESLVFGILSFFATLVNLFISYEFNKVTVLFFCSVFSIGIFLIAKEVKIENSPKMAAITNHLVLIFIILMYFMSTYIGVSNPQNYASLIIGVIVFSQVSFSILPRRNFFTMIIGTVAFLATDFLLKPFEVFSHDFMNATMAAAMGLIISWHKTRDKYEHEEAIELIERTNSSLYYSSMTDPLTGLLNRRNSMEKLEVLAAQCNVSSKKLVCMIIDIDFFKRFNDTYGHPEGDRLLAALGSLLREMQDKYDVTISRIGGEEFMSFFSPKSSEMAETMAQEILERVREIPHPESDKGMFSTVSIGIYEGVALEEDTGNKVYSKADRAMYVAKRNGRDRIEYYNNDFDE